MTDICNKLAVYNVLQETRIDTSLIGEVGYDNILKAHNNGLLTSVREYPVIIQKKCIENFEFFEWLSSLDTITTDIIGNIRYLLECGILDWVFNQQLSKDVLKQLVMKASYSDREVLGCKEKLQFIFDNTKLFSDHSDNVLDYLGKGGYLLNGADSIIKNNIHECIDGECFTQVTEKMSSDKSFYDLVEFIHNECSEYVVSGSIMSTKDVKGLLNIFTSLKTLLGDKFKYYLLNSKSFDESLHIKFLEYADVNASMVVMDPLMLIAYTMDKKYTDIVRDIRANRHLGQLIEYALYNKKYSFLDLIHNNTSVLKNASNGSAVLDKIVYSKILDIDELNLKEITMLANINGIGNLKLIDRKVTFSTLYRLYGLGRNYVLLYNRVLDVDLVCTLALHNSIIGKWTEEQLDTVAGWLMDNDICDFIKHRGLDSALCCKMVVEILKSSKGYVLDNINNQNELEFVHRNIDRLEYNDDIESMMHIFVNDCIEDAMSFIGFDYEYLNKNYDRVYNFALCNGFIGLGKILHNTRISLKQKQAIKECVLDDLENDRFFFEHCFDDYVITISNRVIDIIDYPDKPKKRMINVENGIMSKVLPSLFRDDHKIVTIKKIGVVIANCVLRCFNDCILLDYMTFTDMNSSVKNYLINKLVDILRKNSDKIYMDVSFSRYVMEGVRLIRKNVHFNFKRDDLGDLFTETDGRVKVLMKDSIDMNVLEILEV